jgi:hypothetical protein
MRPEARRNRVLKRKVGSPVEFGNRNLRIRK